MNLFWLDTDPRMNARYHVDKHVVKMPLEYAQMLSTAHHTNGSSVASRVYEAAYIKHPATVWTGSSKEAYDKVLQLFHHTSSEYTYRYGKVHDAYAKLYKTFRKYNPCPDVPCTEPPQCMPDEYKCDDVVQAYRNYYMGDKWEFAKWSKRKRPEWFSFN